MCGAVSCNDRKVRFMTQERNKFSNKLFLPTADILKLARHSAQMQCKRSVVPVCQLDAPRLISHPPLKFSSVGPTQPNPIHFIISLAPCGGLRLSFLHPTEHRIYLCTMPKGGVSQPSSHLKGATLGNINFFGRKLRPLLVAPNVNTRGGRSAAAFAAECKS